MTQLSARTNISNTYPLPSNAVAKAGFGVMWDVINEMSQAAEIDLASAATTDIGAQTTRKLRITGTTGITSFGTTYTGPIIIRFNGALTITHNATTLICPYAANLTVAAGDIIMVSPKCTTSGTFGGWIILSYLPVGGLPVAAATAAAHAVRADQLKSGLTSITAAINTPSAGKITFTLLPCVLDFRNSSVTNGAPNTRFITSTSTLATDNNGASFGATTAVQARLVLLAIDTGSGIVLGVINQSGGVNLNEEGVLTSTTAITGAVTSATTVYTTSALGAGNYPFRVVGAVDAIWTSGSGWVTTPAAVINAGGNALSAMSSIGYGQTPQVVTRTKGTTYYNTTGKPIELYVRAYSGTNGDYFKINVGGAYYASALITATNLDVSCKAIIPPGVAYSWADGVGSFTSSQIIELR